MSAPVLALLLAAVLPGPADFVLPGGAEPLPAAARAAVEGVRPAAIGAHVRFLASPPLEGRGLGSRGLDAAIEYAAAVLANSGVPPLGKSYFQPVPIREIQAPGGTVELELETGRPGAVSRRILTSGVDALVPPIPSRVLEAPVVFAGYGIREKAPARDDWKGLDVRGKAVVLLEGVPEGAAWRTKELLGRWADGDAEERWARKVGIAKELGALLVLGVEGEGWTARILGKEKPWPFAFRGLAEEANPDPVLVRLSPGAGAELRSAVRVSVRATGVERLREGRNVVGVLEGSDPVLRKEAVVLGAHLDHLGVVDGTVHPGADDNASGSAALLEIARVLAASPVRPKRTVVLALWTGEEEDKIGSGFWVRSPLWPLSGTVAYLNLDMIGHPWTGEEIRELVSGGGLGEPAAKAFLERATPESFIEPGVASYAPWLGPVLVRAGTGASLALHFDWTEGVNGGSDYRPFARAKVPFVRFFGNYFPGYHRAGDTAEALDPAPAARIARLCIATAWLIADR